MPNINNNTIVWQDPHIDMATVKIDDHISAVINEVKPWENMTNCHEPLTIDMISFQQLQCHDNTAHSKDTAMYDWEVFGIYARNCLTKWDQCDGTNIVVNIDGTLKAFMIGDLEFFGENQRRMSLDNALR
jgi:hypothetical protein